MSLPISFLSDFGHADEFVGVVHGVIARIAPASRVIDVTHGIGRGDIRGGALALLRAVQYLPQGVVLAVVDPGVGTERRAIAAATTAGFFVGPDNGLLAPAVAMVGGATEVVSIEAEGFILPSAGGATFDGRDRFAPAAAALAAGEARPADLGPALAPDALTPLLLPLVEVAPEGLRGETLWVDHYGNVQTNISPDDLAAAGARPGATLILGVGAAEYELPWEPAYGSVEPGHAVLHVDSYGLVAVAVREGRADETFQLTDRTQIVLRTAPESE